MKKIILISIILFIMTIGAVTASQNNTVSAFDTPIAKVIEEDDGLNSDDIPIESLQMKKNTQPLKSAEKLNASYHIIVDDEYLEKSGYECDFNIEMYERPFLNGNLEIYIDDELKYKINPTTEYDNQYDYDDGKYEYSNSYCLLDINFLDRLGLSYGEHKAEFKYSKDSLFNDFNEIRYFNYTYMLINPPEYENEYESTCNFFVESYYATGNLKIVLDNKTIHDAKFDEYENIEVDFENLTVGAHTYDIYYSGDNHFKAIHKQGIFYKTYEFETYPDAGEMQIDEDFKIYLPDDAKSNVTVVVNNETYLTAAENGVARVKITNLGENLISITYKDDKYYEKTLTKNITVLPGLHFPYSEPCEYQKDASVTLIMPENAKGALKIKINDEYYTSDLINGTASIPLNMISVGVYDFEISYAGDYEDHFKNETYKKINITPATNPDRDWDMEFSFYSALYEGEHILYIKLSKPNDLTGKETYYIDGKKCGEIYENVYDNGLSYKSEGGISSELGKYYSRLSNGTHTLTVSHSGDNTYIAKNKTVTFTKPLNRKILSGVIIDIDYEDLIIELPEGEKGTATITINKTTETISIKNETYISYPLNLKEGIWDINVTYKGNNLNKTKAFKLDTIHEHFGLDCDDIYYKDSVKEAYLNCYEDEKTFKKHASIFIDNKICKEIGEYGEISFNKLSTGTHTLLVNYKNDKNEVIQSVKKTFKIVSYSYPKIELKDVHSQELNGKIDSYDHILILSNDTTLIMEINLNANVNGKVTAYTTLTEFYGRYGDEIYETIIGEYGSFNLNKGKVTINIPTKIFNNTYSLKLTITLKDGNIINQSFKIKWQPKVEHPTKMIYGEKKTLTLHIPGFDNRTIGMFGNFKPIYSKITNGTAKFSLSTLPMRNGITATFIYNQEDYDGYLGYYSSILETYNLKLNVRDTSEKICMYYNDGTTYSLNVSKIYGKAVGKGKTVTFKIGKNTFKEKTDKNGVVKLKISDKITHGTYTLTAIYKYGKITKKLTVKQVLFVKTVKVKKSAKKLVLTATLKKGKTPFKNKQITFKFNGKTFKTKTNSKGIAKVTIKANVLKKLKAGKKITYYTTYLKNTVKKTVKIQK